jgi:hypothetical protein
MARDPETALGVVADEPSQLAGVAEPCRLATVADEPSRLAGVADEPIGLPLERVADEPCRLARESGGDGWRFAPAAFPGCLEPATSRGDRLAARAGRRRVRRAATRTMASSATPMTQRAPAITVHPERFAGPTGRRPLRAPPRPQASTGRGDHGPGRRHRTER